MINKGRRNYWTKENCFKVALECENKHEFETKYRGAYAACIKNKWFVEACSHMLQMKKINNYWNKEKCHEEALKYNTKTKLSKFSRGAYKSALKNKWLDEICSHMSIQGSLYKRYNYIYEFSDNHVYIGLTYDINRRNNDHLNDENSPVYNHIKETGLKPILTYDDLKNAGDAQKKESELIFEYLKKGWNILNKAKAGGLGMIKTKYTKDIAYNEAIKYKSRIEFQKESRSIYRFCLATKIIDEVCAHMKIKMTKNICKTEAIKYITKKEFYCNSPNAYRFSLRNKFLDEICLHML